MSEPILKISPKKYNGETKIISMRVPVDMIKDIDKVAEITGRNRNEILTLSLEFALKHTEIILGNEDKEA